MSGPHAEDDLWKMTDEEVARFIASFQPAPLDPPRRGFHHAPPTTMPHFDDDDEGVGAEDGE